MNYSADRREKNSNEYEQSLVTIEFDKLAKWGVIILTD